MTLKPATTISQSLFEFTHKYRHSSSTRMSIKKKKFYQVVNISEINMFCLSRWCCFVRSCVVKMVSSLVLVAFILF